MITGGKVMKNYNKPNFDEVIISVEDIILTSINKNEGTNKPGEGPGIDIEIKGESYEK